METEMYGSIQGPSDGAPQPSATLRQRRRRRWGGLRQQWKLLGVFEIDPQHEFHGLTCMIKEGLSAAVQKTMDTPPPTNNLMDEDFTMKDTQIHEGFTFQTYAGPVFASFRSALGMSEQEYRLSLCSESSYLQFISNSKSKADFFLTNDKRLFLKTQNKREVRFLLDNLKIYMEHLRKYPHSLLVKFLGVHAIKIPHKRKKYFIVMQSVFYPDDRICGRYDIKGSVVSRWTEPSPPGSQVIEVFKDLNFGKKYIDLGQQRAWLLRQMELDTDFLRRLNVLDYSFLLAHQPLHRDERPPHGFSFSSLIYRTKISVTPGSSPLHPGVPGAVPDDDDNAFSPPSSSYSPPAKTDGGYHVARKSAASSDSSGEEDFLSHNRRLLPRFKNPLHVIDGPEQRYFVGIIDIFTVYGLRKRLEHCWKRLRYPGQSFSTVSPPAYCTRLCAWVKDHTK